MLTVIGILLYFAQQGMFEEQFNIIRRYFEALLPLGDRPNEQRPAQGQDQPRDGATRNLTPEEAAQRLVRRHQDQQYGWIRESMRGTERAFALFVASLWPGIGERVRVSAPTGLKCSR